MFGYFKNMLYLCSGVKKQTKKDINIYGCFA